MSLGVSLLAIRLSEVVFHLEVNMAKFTRGGYKRRSDDNKGTVVVKVYLYDKKGQPTKGNIVSTNRVHNSTVSEVTKAIEEYLFGEKDAKAK